jgi:hypothetical protein
MTAIPPRAAFLAETSWLAGHLGDPDLRLIDIRGSILPLSAPGPHYMAKREACATAGSWPERESEPDDPIEKG